MELILDKKTHSYFLDNKKLTSVSNIINKYLGSKYCKCNNCSFCTNIQLAGYRGNVVHKIAELYFKNINKENILDKVKSTIKPFMNESIKPYCDNLIDYLPRFNNAKDYISEKAFSNDIVAGTPDLVFKTELNLYSIIDFKTYKVMSKDSLQRTKLQLTAYYWILINNGFEMSNTQFIVHVTNEKVNVISVEINKELLHDWEMALTSYKENWYE